MGRILRGNETMLEVLFIMDKWYEEIETQLENGEITEDEFYDAKADLDCECYNWHPELFKGDYFDDDDNFE
jgi:hypothetical protein